ncbi:hypothetical protein COY90_02060 [Candidatus Roizmanbacteria bacterium CG_4_10_14_0_8_um_filter_39_9]|uniref:Peptidoglycan bridge formation protein FemAB n=1 Tax=Candidatus Roizmanbacteria bacterium CG_4_10_14_0_8_um_filter_39_9 TaxID=1974829 RepID=A0A2M7QE64_9BACT|nr:MAG: hypothetical protein COY90_02060 [Candidatus Roizmanbacteria bacterium CG_4_10_14_0_8_um_filter_39_9]
MAPIFIVPETYDQTAFNAAAHHPMQTWEWGEARKETGVEVVRITEQENHIPINVFQFSLHKIPYTPYKIGYLPRSVIPSKHVLDFLFDYAKKNNIIFLKIEPYVENDKFQMTNFKIIKSPHPLFPEWTQMVDLTKTEEELMKDLKPKTRYNIRLAQKKGVVVKEISTDEGFAVFSDLYFATCKRQKYFGHTRKYHEIIWRNLKNNIPHVLIAYLGDIPLAAYELFYFKDVFYYPYGGTSVLHRNAMGANLLMWEAILLGKKLGAKKFDMWGSLPPISLGNSSWSGFTRFKEGYGTKYVEFVGSFDLIVDPVLYAIYNSLHTLRNMYLSLKK